MGRLAATVAKELLNGQRVVVVRCEDLEMSGGFFRNQLKYQDKLVKRTHTNPKRGPFHYHAPGKIFARVIRGMLPHKTQRGQNAMLRYVMRVCGWASCFCIVFPLTFFRLKCFEGIPAPYDTKKRVNCPQALRALRLKPGRKYCTVGSLASAIGWKHAGKFKRTGVGPYYEMCACL